MLLTTFYVCLDPDMEICYKGGRDKDRKTCCSRKMERKYAHAAQRDYHDAIRLHTASLKNLLVSQSSQLKGINMYLVSSLKLGFV